MKSYQVNNDLPIAVADKRKRGYFTVDNILLDQYGKELGPYGVAVYVALARFANADAECWPSRRAIHERTGVSVAQVTREISKLAGLGLITIAPQFDEHGDQVSNLYTLLDIPERPPLISVSSPPSSASAPPLIRESRKQSPKKKVTPPNKNKNDHKRSYVPPPDIDPLTRH